MTTTVVDGEEVSERIATRAGLSKNDPVTRCTRFKHAGDDENVHLCDYCGARAAEHSYVDHLLATARERLGGFDQVVAYLHRQAGIEH